MSGHGAFARLLRRPLAAASLVWLSIVVVASTGATLIAPYGADDQDLIHVLSAPTSSHWLGTGVLGRDVLSRLLFGGQVTLFGVAVSCLIYLAVGVPLGIVAGYVGGWLDRLVVRVADVVYSVPVIIVLLVVIAIFPNNETAAMVTLGLLGAPSLARIVRSITQGLRQELFVKAAQVSGLRPLTIMRRHVLPRVSGTVVVQLSLFGAGAVLLETGLGFLGVGSTRPTWGGAIAEASQNLGTQMWLLVPSGFLVISFILALGLLGDGVRDVMAEGYGQSVTAARSLRRRVRPVPQPLPGGSAEPDALLSVRDLTVAFDRDGIEVPVVTGVDFDVMPGEALGILGESGCGKSITVRSILGLLPGAGQVTGGSIMFDGRDLVGASKRTMRDIRGGRIGWISQEPILSLDPSFTIGSQVVEAVRAHRRCSREEAFSRALELLKLVKLPDPAGVARKYPHQLSGGMAQRAGIAASLAADPVMLIADEPTTALDVTVQAEILDVLRDLQHSGMAIILVTHDLGVLSDLCDRAVVMYAGEVVETGQVTDLLDSARHPYTGALLAANPHDAEPGAPLRAIEGSVPTPVEWPDGCRFANRCPLVAPECEAGPIPLSVLGDRQTRCIRAETPAMAMYQEAACS